MNKKYMPVIVVGNIAVSGSLKLLRGFPEKIESKYPGFIFYRVEKLASDAQTDYENAKAIIKDYQTSVGKSCPEVFYLEEITDGGFMTALWRLAENSGLGMELDLRKVPVKQETIEICELLEVNPYHLLSENACILIVPDGEHLVHKLGQQGITAVIIGETNPGNARVLKNDETLSYLNKPEPDEILRFQS